jgi:hypothetical protein
VADLFCDLIDLFSGSCGNGDADTLACECVCDGTTDTSAAASDQSCFSHG